MPTSPALTAIATTLLVTLAMSGCARDSTIGVNTAPNPGEDVVALAAGSSESAAAAAVEGAVEELPALIEAAMDTSGIPGLAVAVVHNGELVYSDGVGVKMLGGQDSIDAETVFQIASVSKPLSATVVAKAITEGSLTWNTPVSDLLPEFELSSAYVTQNATVSDYFSHRTGLAQGGGDDLEDIGYARDEILDRLRLQPLSAFRSAYNYSNFGITVGAEAAAAASGMSWEDTAAALLYEPLGMTSTSSRYEDFLARENRATLHALIDSEFVPAYERDPDPQAPAGGVSSNVLDLARWMTMVLDGGQHDGAEFIDRAALTAATTGAMISGHPQANTARTGMYGYGFNVGTAVSGRTSLSHSGGFVLGAATHVALVPSLDLGIVTLTNAAPQGVPEAVNAQFLDIVQYGQVTRDWVSDFNGALGGLSNPEGDLVGESVPAGPSPAGPTSDYVGTYHNDYFGELTITAAGEALSAALGPDGGYIVDLSAWDGDTFSFVPTGENAPAGSLSSAAFKRSEGVVSTLTLAFFDRWGWGTWDRVGP